LRGESAPSAGGRENFLTIEELARWLRVELKTIYQWRDRGEGPKGYRVGRRVLFRPSDVLKWLETRADPD
jgi:excisionase family DNA binding protein